MTGVLVIGSVDAGDLSEATAEAISIGAKLAAETGSALIGGLVCSALGNAPQTMARFGLSRLLVAEDARLAGHGGDVMLAAAEALVRESAAHIIVTSADTESGEWAARLAARLSAALATNCVGARVEDGAVVATRTLAGGVLRGEFRLNTPLAVLLVTPGIEAPAIAGDAPCAIETVAIGPVDSRITFVEFVAEDAGDGPSLKNARIVVSGGMGIGSAENWHLVEDAAGALGAAVGATRAAVDVGWAPASRQVGFSGLKIAPDLYVAVGISGALHHLAGIGRAKRVVAINSDGEANIFKAAHIGVVGNAKEIMPAFIARVRELTDR